MQRIEQRFYFRVNRSIQSVETGLAAGGLAIPGFARSVDLAATEDCHVAAHESVSPSSGLPLAGCEDAGSFPEHGTIRLGLSGTASTTLWHMFIRTSGQLYVSFDGKPLDYGNDAVGIGAISSGPMSKTPTRCVLPRSTGDWVFLATRDCRVALGDSRITTVEATVCRAGELVRFVPGELTHLAVETVEINVIGHYGIAGTER